MKKREELPCCEWCGDLIGGHQRFPKTLRVPTESGPRVLKFHDRCLPQFKTANPNLMAQAEAGR